MASETTVAVFVEEDCHACERTLSELEQIRTHYPQIAIKVYDRKLDREQFEKYKVHAVPAIFVNEKLASYGAWKTSDLEELFKTQSTNYKYTKVTVENNALSRAVLSGLAGTAVMTLVMLMGPLMGMPEMNIGQMLGGFMGIPHALGWIAHFMVGTVLALIYVYLFSSRLPGAPWPRGALYGLLLWLVSQIMVNPMMGAGVFASNTPAPFMMVMGSLMGHLAYGAVVGGVYGSGSSKQSVAVSQS
ncbi:MAG: DUF6789 family protein [Bacteroidota bacterium]